MDGKIKILNQSAISQMKVFVDKQNENKNLNNDKSIMPESKKIESTGENVSLDEINAIENINKTNTVKELNNEVLNSIEPDENIEKYLSTEQKEAIIEQFEKEYKKLLEDFETAKNSNGIISGAWDKFKNFTKIGAGSDKTLKEIENLKKEIENLKNNPESFSDCYKNITGSDLTLVSLNRTFDESSNNKTNASKSLEKYTEGQKMATDTIADITSGVAAVRLIAYPLLNIVVLKFSGLAAMVPEGQTILLITLLATITPSASTITQMAQVYGKDADYASAINVVTTLLCIVTMPLMVMLY